MPREIHTTAQTDVVVASAARTATGATAVLPGFGGMALLRCQLDVTVVSGVSPTLAVLLEDTLDGTNFNTVGTFTARTAAGREVINVTAPFTDRLRVSFTLGGTTPSFTFAVALYSEA